METLGETLPIPTDAPHDSEVVLDVDPIQQAMDLLDKEYRPGEVLVCASGTTAEEFARIAAINDPTLRRGFEDGSAIIGPAVRIEDNGVISQLTFGNSVQVWRRPR